MWEGYLLLLSLGSIFDSILVILKELSNCPENHVPCNTEFYLREVIISFKAFNITILFLFYCTVRNLLLMLYDVIGLE
jgi:hypothetical protein